jgi:hypothetical protein
LKCKNCNAEIEENAKICRWCGAELSNTNKKLGTKKRRSIVVGITAGTMIVLLVAIIATSGRWMQPSDKPNKSATVTRIPDGKPTKEAQNISDTIGSTDSSTSVIVGDGDNLDNNNQSGLDTQNTSSDPIQNLFYIKGKNRMVYNTRIDQLDPQVVISKYTEFDQRTNQFYMSEDGKRIIYMTAMKIQPDLSNPTEFELFYTDLTTKNKEKYKIDSGVTQTNINQTATKAYYIKDGGFYVWDIHGKIKLADGVNYFYTSKKGDMHLYTTEDGKCYLMKDNKVLQELGSDVNFMYISDDMSKIYYTKFLSLYYISNGSDPVQLASDINVVKIYETGQIYYTVQSALEEGEDQNALPYLDLYYFSNGKSKLIKKHCLDVGPVYKSVDSHDTQPYITFSVKNSKLKESNSSDQRAAFSTKEIYLCKGADIIGKIAIGDQNAFTMNSKGDTIYYNYVNQENQTTDTYYNTLKGSTLSKSKKLAEDTQGFFAHKNDLIYFKNIDVNSNKQLADMYFNNKKIDSEVEPSSLQTISNTDYYTYNKGEFNALILLHDGKKKKIAEHVKSYYVYNENLIAYIKADEHGMKSLYLYKGMQQDQLIENDVVDILKPFIMLYGVGNWNAYYTE